MSSSKVKANITDILLPVVSVLYLIGIKNWFPVCSSMGETVMSCHWAGKVLTAMAILSIALSFIHMLIPDRKFKAGLDAGMIGLYGLMAIIPGNIIRLCMMSSMSCRTLTRPWTLIFGTVLALICVVDIVLVLVQNSNEKHMRNTRQKEPVQ